MGDRARSGFTILVLCIVLAIVGVLMALLLPAVQSAREATRRSQCQSQLRQWALAMSMHHNAKQHLPYGSAQFWWSDDASKPSRYESLGKRHSWPQQLWPFIEESNLYEQYDFERGFYDEPNTIAHSLAGPTGQAVALYYCPSDRGSPAYAKSDGFWRVRGNYAVNWGPIPFPPVRLRTVHRGIAPFGFADIVSRNRPRLTRFAAITDGLSHTILVGEKIMHPQDSAGDHRGDMLNDDGAGIFMTFDTPNSSNPDFLKPNLRYCRQAPQLPCADGTVWTGIRHAARSRHPDGVNVVLADGSLLFVVETIALHVWQDLSTMNDNYPLGLAILGR